MTPELGADGGNPPQDQTGQSGAQWMPEAHQPVAGGSLDGPDRTAARWAGISGSAVALPLQFRGPTWSDQRSRAQGGRGRREVDEPSLRHPPSRLRSPQHIPGVQVLGWSSAARAYLRFAGGCPPKDRVAPCRDRVAPIADGSLRKPVQEAHSSLEYLTFMTDRIEPFAVRLTTGSITSVAGPDLPTPPTAAMSGWLSQQDRHRLAATLAHSADPGSVGSDTPWVAVVPGRGRRTWVASVSTMWGSGLFYSLIRAPRRELIVATAPAGILAHLPAPKLDHDYLAELVTRQADPFATPFAGVRRLPPGHTMTWDGVGEVAVTAWVGPQVWPKPTVGPDQAVPTYLRTLRQVVHQLAAWAGPVVSTCSGGLDSSMITALLAEQAGDRALLALSHAPHPAARPEQLGWFDPDDSDVAAELIGAYPNVEQQLLVNQPVVSPLVAARRAMERAWWPTSNVGNMPWIEQALTIASRQGTAGIFTGGAGNAGFSLHRSMAAGRRESLRKGSRQFVGNRLRAIGLRPRRNEAVSSSDRLGLPTGPTQPRPGRALHLQWLAGMRHGHAGLLNTDWSEGISWVDPFQARSILDLAASFTPEVWKMGDLDRGFARAVMRGVVPDEIRLRTRRGGQAMDAWFALHDQQDDLLAAADLLRETPVLQDLIDVDRFRAELRAYPWGDSAGNGPDTLVPALRILGLADFVNTMEPRLRDLRV